MQRADNGTCEDALSPATATFREAASEWLAFLRPQLRLQTINKYSNTLNLYLLPNCADWQISKVSRADVSQVISELLLHGGRKGTGLSPKTVTDAYSIIKNIFDFAEREMSLPVVNIDGIPIKQTQRQMRILSDMEQKKLCQYLCNNLSPRNLGILLCIYTGLRIGEICALKWGDISFEDHLLHISRSMQRVQNLDTEGKRTKIVISPPKSICSVRYIPLPEEILQLLRKQRKGNATFLLTGSEKKYIEPRCLHNHFKRVTNACNISDVNFHALRHTFATKCVEIGFDTKSLSEILGHASINITLNRYVHPSMELKRQNMSKLSGLIITENTT